MIDNIDSDLYEDCVIMANKLISSDAVIDLDLFALADLIYKEQINKKQREAYIDSKIIDFNDEVIEIEELDDQELIDIGITGDNLFYADGVLTKNSIGLPMTLDFFFAITTNEVLQDNNRQMFHLLKTRWGNKKKILSHMVGINFDLMRYYDVDSTGNNMTTEEVKSKVGLNKPDFKKGKSEGIEWE